MIGIIVAGGISFLFVLLSTSIGDFMTLDNVKYEVSEVELKEVK